MYDIIFIAKKNCGENGKPLDFTIFPDIRSKHFLKFVICLLPWTSAYCLQNELLKE